MHKPLHQEGALIRKAVDQSLAEGIVTEDLIEGNGKAYKTLEVGNYLAGLIAKV
ncbi:MAG: hypothetical protein VW127_05885 [Flavobacteriaceae bacterium]